MEQYVNNSECKQLNIDEVEECSLGPEYADIDVKAEKGELLVASKWRWEDCQKQRNRKRNKLTGKCEKLKWKISESGVSLLKRRPTEC